MFETDGEGVDNISGKGTADDEADDDTDGELSSCDWGLAEVVRNGS